MAKTLQIWAALSLPVDDYGDHYGEKWQEAIDAKVTHDFTNDPVCIIDELCVTDLFNLYILFSISDHVMLL